MEFRLFDAAVGGNQIKDPVTLNGIAVSNGLFTVTLNTLSEFGMDPFNGEDRWLEIMVDGAVLTPRQPITPAPYATTALSTVGIDGHSLDGFGGSPTDALFVDGVGNVGIGTTSPIRPLHVSDDALFTARFENGHTSAAVVEFR